MKTKLIFLSFVYSATAFSQAPRCPQDAKAGAIQKLQMCQVSWSRECDIMSVAAATGLGGALGGLVGAQRAQAIRSGAYLAKFENNLLKAGYTHLQVTRERILNKIADEVLRDFVSADRYIANANEKAKGRLQSRYIFEFTTGTESARSAPGSKLRSLAEGLSDERFRAKFNASLKEYADSLLGGAVDGPGRSGLRVAGQSLTFSQQDLAASRGIKTLEAIFKKNGITLPAQANHIGLDTILRQFEAVFIRALNASLVEHAAHVGAVAAAGASRAMPSATTLAAKWAARTAAAAGMAAMIAVDPTLSGPPGCGEAIGNRFQYQNGSCGSGPVSSQLVGKNAVTLLDPTKSFCPEIIGISSGDRTEYDQNINIILATQIEKIAAEPKRYSCNNRVLTVIGDNNQEYKVSRTPGQQSNTVKRHFMHVRLGQQIVNSSESEVRRNIKSEKLYTEALANCQANRPLAGSTAASPVRSHSSPQSAH